ncbi:MAG: hypothetical protein IT371_15345 [Deltaproteobacteria bacterium]|nr:hypothetical protein [Deltaproteobacteria bacterium]
MALAREKARLLYEGRLTRHRSCGICLAETFNLRTPPYQALRKGGITGEGQCGAIKAGELILGELFGDPDPTGAVTATLRAALVDYSALWKERLGYGSSTEIICNQLIAPFPEFQSAERARFCTGLAERVAELVAEVALCHGASLEVTPIPDVTEPTQ